MSNIAIQVENLSKAYQLGEIGTGTISRDIERWWAKLRGKEDPFLKIGQTNDRTTKGESNVVWSLKDINFEIEQGQAVGIIGRNGAGKSTLLKILSRVTSPTTGSVKLKGRVASLLEVGTGFHPELTGRENIFLNGAILGMRKAEIKRKFDEIVDFAGVERYIDTPVKRYSSGMYVRLAFAVAAHLESEILIVDEVLAVGDAEFQKKCLGKMGDVSSKEGRTVLFVSHNMGAVLALCNLAMILDKGELLNLNNTDIVINQYNNLSNLKYKLDINGIERTGLGNVKITSFEILSSDIITAGTNLKVQVGYESLENASLIIEIGMSIWSKNQIRLISISTEFKSQISKFEKQGKVTCEVKSLPLIEGDYQINFFINSVAGLEDYIVGISELKIENSNFFSTGKMPNPNWSTLVLDHNWAKIE